MPPTRAFVKAWLTSRTYAIVILTIFCSSTTLSIWQLFLSSTSVFQLSICTRLKKSIAMPSQMPDRWLQALVLRSFKKGFLTK